MPVKWTDEKIAEMRRLRGLGFEWKEIATRLCSTIGVCKYRWLMITKTALQKRIILDQANERNRRRHIKAPKIHRVEGSAVVPESVLVERDARLAAPKSLTGWMFGDPPHGFSALEMRSVA